MIEKLTSPSDIAAAVDEQRRDLKAMGKPESWADTGEVFKDQYVRIVRDAVRFPSGRLGTYIKIEAGADVAGGVIVVPRLADRYVFLRHSRFATGKTHLEFPRGFVDARETAAAAAARELREEIGAVPAALLRLGMIYADTGLMNMPIEVYAAEIEGASIGDGDEGIEGIELFTGAEITAMIAAGGLDDSLTLSAFALNCACTTHRDDTP